MGRQMQECLFPGLVFDGSPSSSNMIADVDHLIAHYLAKRDIFVTGDDDFLGKADRLLSAFGLRVMNPGDALAWLGVPPVVAA